LQRRELGIDHVDVDRRGGERRAGRVLRGGGDRRRAQLDQVAVERAGRVGRAQRGVADGQLDRRDVAGHRELRGQRRGDPAGARLEHVAGQVAPAAGSVNASVTGVGGGASSPPPHPLHPIRVTSMNEQVARIAGILRRGLGWRQGQRLDRRTSDIAR
jgi:hypothetical protein